MSLGQHNEIARHATLRPMNTAGFLISSHFLGNFHLPNVSNHRPKPNPFLPSKKPLFPLPCHWQISVCWCVSPPSILVYWPSGKIKFPFSPFHFPFGLFGCCSFGPCSKTFFSTQFPVAHFHPRIEKKGKIWRTISYSFSFIFFCLSAFWSNSSGAKISKKCVEHLFAFIREFF